MKNTSWIAGVLLAAGLGCTTYAQTQASLLALSKHDHTLAIIDPDSLRVLAKLPVGEDPHEVIASSDGETAYVSNYGFGAYHTIAVLDLVHRQPLASIDLGPLRGPHGLAFVAGKLWFTAEAAKGIGRYDLATHKVDWILGTGQNRTHMIHVSPDTQHIITTNVSSGTVSLIDWGPTVVSGPSVPPPGGRGPLGPPSGGRGFAGPPGAHGPAGPPPQRMDWNDTVVRVGNGSEGFDLSPDGKEIWVANAQDGTISVIDYASRKVVQTLDANVRSANRLKFTPDGKDVLVSTLGGPDLVVFDAASRKVVRRIPMGRGAAGILIQPGGARAFIACSPDNTIAVLDLHSWKVTGHIDVGGEPDGMAWAVRR